MCGVAGFFRVDNVTINNYETYLHAMQQCIAHRGPDDYGIWSDELRGIGLTHRRLAVIDPTPAGKQPMFSRDGSLVISFNGEIYNHLTLRKELESRGYQYASNTDTETILYAFQEWGINCLERLDGDFAFALYDLKHDELFLVRDRIGVIPLYFSLQQGVLSFASEIKALWELPYNEKTISNQALYHYLTFMVTPAPMTMFKNVYKLPAGYYAHINAGKQLHFTEWYSPLKKYSQTEQQQFSNEQFCLENIRTLLIDSIRKRMMSDVPFGVFLSGGLDSSLNVALMSRFTDKKVKTFSVAFADGPEFDELGWARLVADRYSTEHHEIIISEKEAFNFYESMVHHLDEPLADSVCIPFYFVAKLAKEHGVSVAQAGEGADELFFGYQTYVQYKHLHDRMWKPAQRYLPHLIRKQLKFAGSLFTGKRLSHTELLHNWAEGRELFWGGALAFNESQKHTILKADFFDTQVCSYDPIIAKIYQGMRQELDSFAVVDYHTSTLKKQGLDNDFGRKMLYLELKQRLPELLLMRANKMAMATGVEVRVPYLDPALVEFMLQVPTSLKFKHHETKYLLKKVARGLLPDIIIDRKKVGFATPTERWFTQGALFPAYFQKLLVNNNKYCTDSVQQLNKLYHASTSSTAVQHWVLQNLWALNI